MDSTTEATNSVQQASINNKKPKKRKQAAVATAAVPVTLKKYNLRIKSTTIRMNESQFYRNSTNANHHQNRNESPLKDNKLLKHKPPPLSKYRRRTANLRERCRMQEINDAFKKLQSVVPDLFSIADTENNHLNHHHLSNNNNYSNQSIAKLTKINTLKLAVNYISALTQILKQSDDPNNNNTDMDMDKSKPPPLDINTNRCTSEFHFATGLEPQSHSTSSISKNVEFSSSSSSSLSSPPPPLLSSSSSSSSSFMIQATRINSYPSNENNPPPSIGFQNSIPNIPTPTTVNTRAEDYFQDIHLVHHHHHPHLLASSSSVSSSFSNHNVEKFKITTNRNENNDDDLANNIDTIFDDLDCLLFEDYGS